jgi:hypothetical protein
VFSYRERIFIVDIFRREKRNGVRAVMAMAARCLLLANFRRQLPTSASGQGVQRDEKFLNDMAADEVFLNDAFEDGRIALGIPRAFGIYQRDGAA